MTSSRDRRVAKELADIRADRNSSGVFAYPKDGVNLKMLRGTFPAPPDTPYAGGTYEVEIEIPDTYPFKSPRIRFTTKIWHPNISSQTGAICLDTLGSGWSPVQTIKTALLSLRLLLETPNPKDPQDAEVARMLLDDPERFALVAHDWANDASRYMGYSQALVERFVNMGFDVDAVVEAFMFVGIDRNGGQDYQLEEAYMGDITARLLGEQ
ncbi:Ubiquitin-conjugating enzyme E2 27 [Escovopsis weberi]|uniref:Ubiquitin-conjugating enzyme E2 2 n=1 Tax=Escovopsis weberi TaxID=150374 RepID=A0A0M9VWV3_ESCWE|nr:Ubiquitin-conjugating enzyme E2 27 [Escovopsis weberi]